MEIATGKAAATTKTATRLSQSLYAVVNTGGNIYI